MSIATTSLTRSFAAHIILGTSRHILWFANWHFIALAMRRIRRLATVEVLSQH